MIFTDFSFLPHPLSVRAICRELSFKQPAGTSRGVYLTRRIWYVVITSPTCRRLLGLGECAPLPDLSCDAGPDYAERLRAACHCLETTGRVDFESLRAFPSITFGLETALLSAKASLQGGDFLTLFDTPYTRGETPIRINGLVWMGRRDEMMARMEDKIKQGFRCVKLKIGAIDFEEEMSLIACLRSRFGENEMELRVDANGAFRPDEAMHKLERLAAFGIHSIEQPIRAGQWNEMAGLCRQSPIAIALDEELIGINKPDEKRKLLETIRPQYIILKPSLHGGLSGCEEWMKLAADLDIPNWVTSALESNVGLNAIAQWTSAIRDKYPCPTRQLPPVQGLGTGGLFVTNFPFTTMSLESDQLWNKPQDERLFRQEVQAFEREWRSASETLMVKTSGSTGEPKTMEVKKCHMAASACRTVKTLGLQAGNTALLCLPLQYIAGKMMAVRAFTAGLRLVCVPPSSHPFARLHTSPTFAALTPHQVWETLQVAREAERLKRVPHLIIGGGAIDQALAEILRSWPGAVWSTYGMTETLSHIALRRLNGPEADEAYTLLEGVGIETDNDGRLIITDTATGGQRLVTNDLATLLPGRRFVVRGRCDNVICSGGIKIQAEKLENQLSFTGLPLAITAVADTRLGQAVTLIFEKDGQHDETWWKSLCDTHLERLERPRHFIAVDHLPLTETGKPARQRLKQLAAETLCAESDNVVEE